MRTEKEPAALNASKCHTVSRPQGRGMRVAVLVTSDDRQAASKGRQGGGQRRHSSKWVLGVVAARWRRARALAPPYLYPRLSTHNRYISTPTLIHPEHFAPLSTGPDDDVHTLSCPWPTHPPCQVVSR